MSYAYSAKEDPEIPDEPPPPYWPPGWDFPPIPPVVPPEFPPNMYPFCRIYDASSHTFDPTFTSTETLNLYFFEPEGAEPYIGNAWSISLASGTKFPYVIAVNPHIITAISMDADSINEMYIAQFTGLTSLDISSNNITDIDVSDLASLATLTADNQGDTVTSLDLTGTALTSVDMRSCGLSASLVDEALDDLDGLANNNGTVNLRSNTAPSAAGLASKTSLEGRGWTVFIDDVDSSLILNFEDAAGSLTTTDEGGGTNCPHTVSTPLGIKTTDYKWGNSSAYWDDTLGSDGAAIAASSSDWNLFHTTITTWTIEGWIKPTGGTGVFLAYCEQSATDYWWIDLSTATRMRIIVVSGGVSKINIDQNGGLSIPNGSWTHWAVTRNGSTYQMFVGGNRVNSTVDADTASITGAINFAIGGAGASNGYIDSVRISTVVRYSGATYTVPTGPF